MSIKPKISVIMGIYTSKNKEMIRYAIDSIINQTFKEWEFVICDDGSPDDTWDFLNSEYGNDERFVLIHNETNGGLRVALNTCLAAATADYVARMDADDYSRPDRLEKLYNYVIENPDVDVVGTAMMSFDDDGEKGILHVRKLKPSKIDFVHGTIVAHATTIMKKSSLIAVGGYRVAWETIRCEDLDLYMRMFANGAKFHNIDDPMYYFRQDSESIKRRKYKNRIKEFLVKFKGFRLLHMPLYSYVFVLKPLVVGLIPKTLLEHIKAYIK